MKWTLNKSEINKYKSVSDPTKSLWWEIKYILAIITWHGKSEIIQSMWL